MTLGLSPDVPSPGSRPTSPPDPTLLLEQLREQERTGALGPLLPFWGHKALRGNVGPWVLSQWWSGHPFELGGRTLSCAETAMMWAKAVIFNDATIAEEILNARSAAEVKALGRKVRGYDDAHWNSVRYGIVVRANRAKFAQHPELRAYLLSTRPAVLVEASPYDKIWGIGLGPDHPDAHSPLAWRGTNLLGFALTHVRDELTSPS